MPSKRDYEEAARKSNRDTLNEIRRTIEIRTVAKNYKEALNAAQMANYKNLTNKQLYTIFDGYTGKIELTLKKPGLERIYAAHNTHSSYLNTISYLRNVDRSVWAARLKLRKILGTSLPKLFALFDKASETSDDFENLPDVEAFAVKVEVISKALSEQYPKPVKAQPQMSATPLRGAGQKALPAVEANVAPEVTAVFKKIAALVAELQKMKLSPEDEYFMESITNEYLPSISNAAKSLTVADEWTRVEANRNFVTQLSLIEKRLTELLDGAHEGTLREVKVQTSFLRQKFGDKDKGLQL